MAVLIRQLRPDDTALIVAFYEQAHIEDPAIPAVSAREWSRFLRQTVNANGSGFRVAEDNATCVALATSSLRSTQREIVRHFRVIVLPAKRRQRIGTLLLASIAGIDHGQENMMLQCLCPRAWISGRAFLDHYGFSLVDTEWYMRLDDRPRPEPPPRGDYVIESAHSPASHAPEIAVLHNRAYCEDTSFMPYSSEAMARALSDDVTLWLLRYRGMLIGYCHVELLETEVWIESLVIDPDHQGCGLGRSLATTVLSESIGNVRPTARLQVSDHNRTAMNLYTSLGFRSTSASYRMRAARPTVLVQLDRLE